MLRAIPNVRYVVYFTPRSGSSRLADLMQDAGGLGIPGEYFNPRLIRKAAIFLGAQDLDDYLGLILRQKSENETFGSKIAVSHLYQVFFREKKFFDLYQPTSSLFLIREDIVEQAVSLSRMAQTGFAHHTSSSDPKSTYPCFTYNPTQIRIKLYQLLSMERQMERIFLLRGIEPLRLSYELLNQSGPANFLPLIAQHIGCIPQKTVNVASEHGKIVDDRSIEFARRFKSENQTLMAKVDKERSFTLNELEKKLGSLELKTIRVDGGERVSGLIFSSLAK